MNSKPLGLTPFNQSLFRAARRGRTFLVPILTVLSMFAAEGLSGFAQTVTRQTVTWQAGFAKVDVTPEEPIRLSGYGSRDHPLEGIETKLFVRAVCLRSDGDAGPGKPVVLLTIDNVGLSGALTRELSDRLKERHGLDRRQVVFSNTHTHSAPGLNDQLANIFSKPLNADELAAAGRYRQTISDAILKAVGQAIEDLAPARISYGVTESHFAANRRVLADGRWSGFGVQADGPVDHRVPVLRIGSADGTRLRGVIFNYACHCTTLGGADYRVNADWAGYATAEIERRHQGAFALCSIGCGADSNPNPRGTVDLAKMHGQSLASAVEELIAKPMRELTSPVEARFDYAALSFDLPTREELEQRLEETGPQTRRHAEKMLRVYDEMGRLPATYPVPIQSWRFGEQLGMIFIGGEVVVDYALRLKRELGDESLWVSAYCNDVMGYVASERMRAEGGYEFDRSGIYYSLPGPWAAGTEDALIEKILRLYEGKGRAQSVPAEESTGMMRLSAGFEIELVASEPLVQDPVNLAFSDDGGIWVVEMGGYPETASGGRVKLLSDQDGDGRFDQASVFLEGLSYPTGVFPWRDGVVVTCAPDVLFASDSDGDGKADHVEKLYSGFPLANPQHRVNGLTYGLDHSLHLASGDNLDEIHSRGTGAVVEAGGHDIKIWPDTGELAVTSGRTQFIRSRDSAGRWFGNSNSRPMFHYPIEDRYLGRNPKVRFRTNSSSLFDPPVAPPVFPITSVEQRFNDLFAAGRFTSACSSIVVESPGFEAKIDGRGFPSIFVCEPVHNLVHRSALVAKGSSFESRRVSEESEREFLASADPWFRPVRAIEGPDGALYIVDMYREVIEHPEWIPQAWQSRLDIRAGENRGRLYRVFPKTDQQTDGIPSLADEGAKATGKLKLLSDLNSPIAARRDRAQRRLLHSEPLTEKRSLNAMAVDHAHPLGQIHALSILDVAGALNTETIVEVLKRSQANTLLVALRLSESFLDQPDVLDAVVSLADHEDVSVALQLALTLGESEASEAGRALGTISCREDLDAWLVDAVVCSSAFHADAVFEVLLRDIGVSPSSLLPMRFDLLSRLASSVRGDREFLRAECLRLLNSAELSVDLRFQLVESLAGWLEGETGELSVDAILPLYRRAKALAVDPDSSEAFRCRAVSLIGAVELDDGRDEFLLSLLEPSVPSAVQCQAIRSAALVGNHDTFGRYWELWPSLSLPVRAELIGVALSSRTRTEQLLERLEGGTVKANDIPLASRQQLLNSGNRSMRVRARRLLGAGQTTDRGRLVRQYLAKFKGGQSMRERESLTLDQGANLFQKHCGVCHQPPQGSSAIGPNLGNLTNRSDVALVEAVLNPNRSVEPKYQSYVVQTTDGRTLAGVIESEVGNSLTLAHADGKRSTVQRSEIERLKNSGLSLMPEGFEEVLSAGQMEAIVRYLQGVGTGH